MKTVLWPFRSTYNSGGKLQIDFIYLKNMKSSKL